MTPIMNLGKIADQVIAKWGTKPLEELRVQARAEPTGIAFDALRTPEGVRFILVLCITKPDLIASLQKVVVLEGANVSEDWTKLTVLEVVTRASKGAGFAFECLRSDSGAISDLMLISTEPRSMAMLQRLFKMPD